MLNEEATQENIIRGDIVIRNQCKLICIFKFLIRFLRNENLNLFVLILNDSFMYDGIPV
jgi:hypothetical protein|tara:strand:+ start:398 stop:574 length:177 start_codon:yes stop_codon:yes gene_type:complete